MQQSHGGLLGRTCMPCVAKRTESERKGGGLTFIRLMCVSKMNRIFQVATYVVVYCLARRPWSLTLRATKAPGGGNTGLGV